MKLKKSPLLKKVKCKQKIHSEKRLHCEKCDYKTNKNSHLKRHIKTHKTKAEPPAKKIKCDQCSQIFSDKFNLDRHVKNVHGEEMNCPHCNFKTKIQQTFTNHVSKCKKKVEIHMTGASTNPKKLTLKKN